jgi:membrane-associated phospholipid phosphatase
VWIGRGSEMAISRTTPAVLVAVLLFLGGSFQGFCQEPATEGQTQGQPVSSEAGTGAQPENPANEALKQKDIYNETGYLHPFRRMSKFVLKDQERIWTSPFHTKKSDIKYWLIFGAAAGTLVAFDADIQRDAPHPHTLVSIGTNGSYAGASYTLLPLTAGFYLIGSQSGDERFREASLLSFETLADTTIVEEVLKVVSDRQRPLEGNGQGNFFQSNDRLNSGFPSGHSINTFGLASVFVHEYPHKFWVKALAVTYATGVALSRLAAEKHFPSDTLVGGVMGWFIGDYVYDGRHNPDLDERRTTAQKILAHVRIGGAI